MIEFLSGKLKTSTNQHITLLVNGVGYGVNVSNSALFSYETDINLHIYYHFNQETGPQLYGFLEEDERSIFALILSVSGFGPKIALCTVSSISPSDFISAIVSNDIKKISSIDGIGPKKAETLIHYLKSKLAKITLKSHYSVAYSNLKDVISALESLGYNSNEISNAVDYIKLNCDISNSNFDVLLKKGLLFLSK